MTEAGTAPAPHGYLSLTDADRRRMLGTIGVASVEDLFADIPPELRVEGLLDLPPALGEVELHDHLAALAAQNVDQDSELSFLGFGMYPHHVPAVVDAITSRGEFLTAYTPYQPERSQGLLQAIFEYQTAIAELTALPVANASMYDGATAATEGVIMATTQRGRHRALVSAGVHPDTRAVLATYADGLGIELEEIPLAGGVTDVGALTARLGDGVGAVLVQHPNALGCLEPMPSIGARCAEAGAPLVAAVDPLSLGVLAPPGDYGAHVAVGEGQPLGNAVAFGGPTFGFLACRADYLRRLPGRLAGETVDEDGRRGYVLTFQTREQHIRRERATSNICSNHALNALAAVVYLGWLGRRGIVEIGELIARRLAYLAERLTRIPGVERTFAAPCFREVAVRLPEPAAECRRALQEQGINPGHPLGTSYPGLDDHLLVAVTERHPRAALDRLADALEARYA